MMHLSDNKKTVKLYVDSCFPVNASVYGMCEVRYSSLYKGFAHWCIVTPIGKKKVIHSKQISCLLLFRLAQLQAVKCFYICYHAYHMHARGWHTESEDVRIS